MPHHAAQIVTSLVLAAEHKDELILDITQAGKVARLIQLGPRFSCKKVSSSRQKATDHLCIGHLENHVISNLTPKHRRILESHLHVTWTNDRESLNPLLASFDFIIGQDASLKLRAANWHGEVPGCTTTKDNLLLESPAEQADKFDLLTWR